jgi:hypothetical protein
VMNVSAARVVVFIVVVWWLKLLPLLWTAQLCGADHEMSSLRCNPAFVVCCGSSSVWTEGGRHSGKIYTVARVCNLCDRNDHRTVAVKCLTQQYRIWAVPVS